MRFSVISLLLLAAAAAAQAEDFKGRENLEKIAIRAYATQEFATALAAYEKIAALEPSAWNFQRAADAAASGARWTDARRLYKKALREAVREGGREPAALLRARLEKLPVDPAVIARLIDDERFDEAFRRLKEYLNLNAGDVWAMSLLGFVYEEIGQDKPAERLYRQAVKIQPEHPTPHYYYGRYLLLKKKKFEEALDELKVFRERLGGSPQTSAVERRAMAGEKYQATRWIASILDTVLKRPDEAFRELEPLVRTASPDPELLYDYGALAARLGKKRTAFGAFQKIIDRAPETALADHARAAIDVLRNTDTGGNPYADPYS